MAVGGQATGDPPAQNSRSSQPGEQLERWAALTQMRTAPAPGSLHPRSSHPRSSLPLSSHLSGLRALSPLLLSSLRPGHLPPYRGRAGCPGKPPILPALLTPSRSSLTCCRAQVPASVMPSPLRPLAPSSRRPCAASASPLHGSPSRSRCSRGESPAASGSSKYRRAREGPGAPSRGRGWQGREQRGGTDGPWEKRDRRAEAIAGASRKCLRRLLQVCKRALRRSGGP